MIFRALNLNIFFLHFELIFDNNAISRSLLGTKTYNNSRFDSNTRRECLETLSLWPNWTKNVLHGNYAHLHDKNKQIKQQAVIFVANK